MTDRPAIRLSSARTLALVLVALLAIALLRTAWISDDAYITFRCLDNLVHGYGLRWNVAERVQVYTHPLWLMLLAPLYAVTGEIYYTAIAAGAILSLIAAALAAAPLARRPSAGALAAALLLSSRAFVDYSTSGLENPLSHVLLALFFWLLFRRDDWTPADARSLCFAGGALLVTRLDLGLLILPALAVALWKTGWRRSIRPALVGLAPLAAWFAFSLLYYGFLLPNSAVAKLSHGLPRGELLVQGFAYFTNSLRADPLTLAAIAAALIVAAVSRDARWRALAAGLVAYLLYVGWVGGDFMSGRFFTAPLYLAALVLASHPVRWSARVDWAAAAVVLVIGFAAPAPPLLSGPDHGLEPSSMLDGNGIADERAVYFQQSGLWNGKRGPKPESPKVSYARRLRARNAPLVAMGAVGYVGYFAGPAVHIVDFHGLGDPLLARLPAVVDDPYYRRFMTDLRGAPAPRGWRPGHFRRTVPAGYLSFVAGGHDPFADPRLEAYARKIALVTRGPLLSGARLVQILRFNLGLENSLIDPAPLRRAAEPRWEEVIAAYPVFAEPYYELGNSRVEEGKPDEALSFFERALQLDPRHADAATNIGSVYLRRGQLDRALEFYRKAVELDPAMADVQVQLAELYDRLGKPDFSLAAAQRALELDPRSAGALFSLGVAYGKTGRVEDALRAFERAAALRPDDAETHYNIGYAHAKKGERALAVQAWRRAARLGSKEAERSLIEAGEGR